LVTIDNSGRQLLKYEDVIMDEDSNLAYSVDGHDGPLTATADVRHKLELQYFASDEQRRQIVDIKTSNVMTSNFETFNLVSALSNFFARPFIDLSNK
jgi:hypothetical protein